MNAYQSLKQKHQQEISVFPMVFAFGQKQFESAMKKLGLKPTDTDKVCSLYGAGDIMRKADVPDYIKLIKRQHKELKDAINADKIGDGFIYDMFSTELANHEYCITCDLSDTLSVLNLTVEEVNADPRLLHGLCKATKEQTI